MLSASKGKRTTSSRKTGLVVGGTSQHASGAGTCRSDNGAKFLVVSEESGACPSAGMQGCQTGAMHCFDGCGKSRSRGTFEPEKCCSWILARWQRPKTQGCHRARVSSYCTSPAAPGTLKKQLKCNYLLFLPTNARAVRGDGGREAGY